MSTQPTAQTLIDEHKQAVIEGLQDPTTAHDLGVFSRTLGNLHHAQLLLDHYSEEEALNILARLEPDGVVA